MKAAFVSTAFAVAVSAGYEGLIPGTTVPLIYNDKIAYPETVYNGTQYNATEINGVAYNNSNEWPCLDKDGYVSILPTCSHYCIELALGQDGCDVDDFSCHCETLSSYKLDSVVVPCLTTPPTATCNEDEIHQLVNFVHGALCPYFEAVTDEAYANCPYTPPTGGAGYGSPTDEEEYETATKGEGYATATEPEGYATATESGWDAEETDCEEDDGDWDGNGDDGYGPATTTVTGWHTVTSEVCETSTVASWEKTCSEPTTWGVGTETWTITKSTVITITNWPITVTTTHTSTWSENWTSVEDPVKQTWVPGSWGGSGSPAASAGAWAEGSATGKWAKPTGGADGEWAKPTGGADGEWDADSSSSAADGAWGKGGASSSAAGGAWGKASSTTPAGADKASTSASSSGKWPAQFTGAASNNKVAAGVMGVAAAAALLI